MLHSWDAGRSAHPNAARKCSGIWTVTSGRKSLRSVAEACPRPLFFSPLVSAVFGGGEKNQVARPSRGNSRALGAGLTLAVSVALFAAGGQWLDARFGTKPWLLLVCCGCGIVGGILHLIRVLAPEMWPFGKLPRNDPPPPAS
jgi:hypothetical protein